MTGITHAEVVATADDGVSDVQSSDWNDPHLGGLLNTGGGRDLVSTVAAAGSTETLDLAAGNVHDVTLNADCTFTFAGAATGFLCTLVLILRQNGTGGWDATWPGSVVWAGGTPPTLSLDPSAVEWLVFSTVNGGTTWYGFPSA